MAIVSTADAPDLIAQTQDTAVTQNLATPRAREPTFCSRKIGPVPPYLSCQVSGGIEGLPNNNAGQPFAGNPTQIEAGPGQAAPALPTVWPSTAPWTLELFAECQPDPDETETSFFCESTATYDAVTVTLLYAAPNLIAQIVVNSQGTEMVLAQSTAAYTTGKHHVCAMFDGNDYYIALDGVVVNGGHGFNWQINLTSAANLIWQLYAWAFTGTTQPAIMGPCKLDTGLTYATTGFTPPAALTRDTNTIWLVPMSEMSGNTAQEIVSGQNLKFGFNGAYPTGYSLPWHAWI